VTDSPIDSPSDELAGRIRALPGDEATAALPRVLTGERNPAALAAGLNPVWHRRRPGHPGPGSIPPNPSHLPDRGDAVTDTPTDRPIDSPSDDLAGRIRALPDDEATAALAFALDVEDASQAEVERLGEAAERVPQAFADADIDLGDRPAGTVTGGDLARSALLYLAGRPASRPVVARALARPRREGQRDPVTVTVIALAVLALRADVDLRRTTTGKWSFHFRLKPVKDRLLVDVLAKLWALAGGPPGHGGENPGGDQDGSGPGAGTAG
jgi:hypothetical protein